jgi:hypothetical protein
VEKKLSATALMLLCRVNRNLRVVRGGASVAVPLQDLKDLPRDVALETPQNLRLRQSLLGSTGDILARASVAAHTYEGDYPKCPIRVSVASAVQTVSMLPSRRGVERRDATEGCERRFSLKTFGIVAGRYQECTCHLRADAA